MKKFESKALQNPHTIKGGNADYKSGGGTTVKGKIIDLNP